MSSPLAGDGEFARIKRQLSPPPFPLVGAESWSGMRYAAGWGGNDHEVQRVTLGHVSSPQEQLYIETAGWPHPTTSSRLARRASAPPPAGPPIALIIDGAAVELVRVPVRSWHQEHAHGAAVAPWAGVGRLGGDEPGGIEFSIEAIGLEPVDVPLVVGVDVLPYLRTTEELEQRRESGGDG